MKEQIISNLSKTKYKVIIGLCLVLTTLSGLLWGNAIPVIWLVIALACLAAAKEDNLLSLGSYIIFVIMLLLELVGILKLIGVVEIESIWWNKILSSMLLDVGFILAAVLLVLNDQEDEEGNKKAVAPLLIKVENIAALAGLTGIMVLTVAGALYSPKSISADKLTDGVSVVIRNKQDEKLVLSVIDGSLTFLEEKYDATQVFTVKAFDNGYWGLKANDGNMIDVYNGEFYSGNKVSLWMENGGDNQKWKLTDVSGMGVAIGAYDKSLYLTKNNADGMQSGIIADWNGDAAQLYTLEVQGGMVQLIASRIALIGSPVWLWLIAVLAFGGIIMSILHTVKRR